jgi:tRNA(fMet)-specific endonuclease VapC
MATRYLFDTNIISVLIRRPPAALQRRLRRTSADRVALSVVTEMELRYGLARNPGLSIAPLVEEFLNGVTVMPLTSEVARHYAIIRVALEAKGTPIGPLDLMIAAHCLTLGLTLVTSDLGEFSRVPGLTAVDWTK